MNNEVHMLGVDAPGAVDRAAEALDRGLVVAVPTETVYGLAARADRPAAVRRLFELKGRRREVAVAVLVAGIEQAASMGLVSPRARRLGEAFWPGPLTIVVAKPPGLTVDVGGHGGTVGLRVPDHPALRALLAVTGPLATTSANLSGSPTPPTAAGVAAVFGSSVALYLDGGPSGDLPPSTVVSVVGETLTVLREGPVSAEALKRALRTR